VIGVTVFDLDGTLNNDLDRRDQMPDWDSYHALHISDTYYADVWTIWKLLNQANIGVAVMTGRHETFRPGTIKQLQQWGLSWQFLYMRPDQDRRPTPEVKFTWVNSLAKKGYRVTEAFDDDPRTIDMFVGLKIPAFYVVRQQPFIHFEGEVG
jgi:hypothetical protein